MPSQPKNPYGSAWNYEAYAQCSWCAQDYPASLVWYNPRFGWQCFKCWDGLVQRDQILQPIFPFEGTRKTPAPLTNTLLEGITPGTLLQNFTWVFLDVDGSGRLWSVNFNSSPLPTVTQVFSVPDTQDRAFDYVVANNGFRVLVFNGFLVASTSKPASCPTGDGYFIQLCDTGTAFVFVNTGGGITYTPPGGVPTPVPPPPVPGPTCVIDKHPIHEDFNNPFCPTNIHAIHETFEVQFCPTNVHAIHETFEVA